ncbi:MAG: hypothetical protein IKU48_02160 [Clostridia bacterium]|nr:hypothetical protein [Clostridia bacterium]
MLQKKSKTQNSTAHLEYAVYKTPPESATDFTGYNPYFSDSDEKAENLSDLMNVPTSPPYSKK